MPVFSTATILTLAGLAVAGASAGYGVEQGMEAKSDAKDAKNEANDKMMKAEADLQAKKAKEMQDQATRAGDASKKMQLLQGGRTDQGGTVKTGPLGLVGQDNSSYARKMALGL